MRAKILFLVTAAISGAGANAQSAQPPQIDDAINMAGSNLTQSVDCKGRNLAVSGDNDTLNISHCGAITVVGNHDRLSAHLLRSSTIAVLGNHDHVVFEDEPGFDPQVTSSGTDDEIVPMMSEKDMKPNVWRPK